MDLKALTEIWAEPDPPDSYHLPRTVSMDIPADWSQGKCDESNPEHPEVTCLFPKVAVETYHIMWGGHVGTDANGVTYAWAS